MTEAYAAAQIQPLGGEDEPDFGWPWAKEEDLLERIGRPITSNELIDLLKTREDANDVDKDGFAPIHLIVKHKHRNRSDLITTLIMHSNANINITSSKEGMSALHFAVEVDDLESMRTLVALGANVNLQDQYGHKTPLDVALLKAQNKRPSPGSNTLVQLESLHSGPNRVIVSGRNALEKGFTQTVDLTESIDSSTVNIVPKAPRSQMIEELESVGAVAGKNLTCTTPSNEQPLRKKDRKETTDTKRRSSATYFRNLEASIIKVIQDNDHEPTAEQSLELIKMMRENLRYRKKCGSRILCLDGGGVKGLIQLEILRQIEKMTGKEITELFDWIVGTSTGGIIALTLVYGKKSVTDLQRIYLKEKDAIFGGGRGILSKGNSVKLQRVLQEWLGEDVRMDDVKHPKVLIPAVNKEHTHLQLHFFNNCFGDEHSNELVWMVARYTSAAPFYFTEKDNYIDGGILANNPSQDALTAIQEFYREKGQKIPISLLMSVGSGVNPPKDIGNIDVHISTFNPRAWMDFFEVLGSAVLNRTTVSNCRSRCWEQDIDFFRFSPDLEEEIESEETNNSKLLAMLWRTRVYMHENRDEVERLVKLLQESELCTLE